MKVRGRPRDASVDEQVRAATLDILAERGRYGASVEAVAARSGVAKSSIYRRWSGRDEMIMDALATLFEVSEVVASGSDDPREQLSALLEQLRDQWADPMFRRLMRRLAADGSEAPEDYRLFREQLISRRRDILRAALSRCVEAGIVRADVDLQWVADLLVAPVIVAAMTHRNDVSVEQLEFSVDTVLTGLAPH